MRFDQKMIVGWFVILCAPVLFMKKCNKMKEIAVNRNNIPTKGKENTVNVYVLQQPDDCIEYFL